MIFLFILKVPDSTESLATPQNSIDISEQIPQPVLSFTFVHLQSEVKLKFLPLACSSDKCFSWSEAIHVHLHYASY